MSSASPLECRTDADCTQRSTSSSAMPSAEEHVDPRRPFVAAAVGGPLPPRVADAIWHVPAHTPRAGRVSSAQCFAGSSRCSLSWPSASRRSALPPRRARRRRRRARSSTSATTGTARPTSSSRASSGGIARINIVPDIAERMAEIQSDPERLGYFLAIRELVGEGHDQFVDDMFSSHDGRVLVRLAAELRRRRRDRPAHRQDRLAHAGGRATAPTTWRSRRTASGCSVSASTAQGRRRDRHATGRDRRRASRPATSRTRTTSHGRQRDLPREHRHGLHAARRPGARRDQGRARVRDRRREQLQGAQRRIDMGQKLEGVRRAGHERRGAADGAVAGRAARSTSRSRSSTASSSTTCSRTA